LHLYRQIMRIHKDKLPGPFKELGNTYVRDEFRRHRTATTTPEQWKQFIGEWQKYADMLAGTADLPGASGSISDDVLLHMNAEQKQRLDMLKSEALKAGESLLTGRPDQGSHT
jgi:Complex1_LYR-like